MKGLLMKMMPSKKSRNLRRSFTKPAVAEVQQILATTDFSNESNVGVRYASALAKKLSAAVVLLNVIEAPPRLAGMEALIDARDGVEVMATCRRRLASVAKRELGG